MKNKKKRRLISFNTQPPEGGWIAESNIPTISTSFNTQPPEGGWASTVAPIRAVAVSTHSRLKAAGISLDGLIGFIGVSTHSRLKAAGHRDAWR